MLGIYSIIIDLLFFYTTIFNSAGGGGSVAISPVPCDLFPTCIEALTHLKKVVSVLASVESNRTTSLVSSLKKLSSAWGIYHRRENYISFNIDLIEKDIESIDYVVLHEICHIFYMDHQKKFWALVEKYMPDYKIRRKKLKS